MIDWLGIQAVFGAIVPPLIELFFKNVHKTAKIVIVALVTLAMTFLQMGINGKWGLPELPLPVYQIIINFFVLMYLSIGSFQGFWKKFFPNDTPPDIGVPIKEDNNYKTLTE
jgi:hypothetical protein